MCEINDAPGVWVCVCVLRVYTGMCLYTGAGSSNSKTPSHRLCKTTSKETASGHKK